MTLPQAVERVAAAARKHGKAWAITAGNVEDLARYRSMGAQLIPWGGDYALFKVLENCSAQLDAILS
jgi:2-keto-3-deoxy-L-rhamnonate aldolase RhmA